MLEEERRKLGQAPSSETYFYARLTELEEGIMFGLTPLVEKKTYTTTIHDKTIRRQQYQRRLICNGIVRSKTARAENSLALN